MKKTFLLTLIILIIITLLSIYKDNEIYANPLKDYDSSIFKLVLLEDLEDIKTNAMASGFAFKANDNNVYLLTNYHFCAESINNYVLIQNFEDKYLNKGSLGVITHYDVDKDLCIIKPEEKLIPLKIRKKADIHIGKELFIIGAPEGNFPHISQTIVSKEKVRKDILKLIFADMDLSKEAFLVSGDVYFGQSGSPVVNKRGEVEGLIFAKYKDNTGLIMRSEDILEYIDSFE